MTPEREREIVDTLEAAQVKERGIPQAVEMGRVIGCAAALLAALDAVRAREARLREAAAGVFDLHSNDHQECQDGDPCRMKIERLRDVLHADSADSWLADRERAAAVRALRWAATRLEAQVDAMARARQATNGITAPPRAQPWQSLVPLGPEGHVPGALLHAADGLRSLADAIEAGTEEVPRGR